MLLQCKTTKTLGHLIEVRHSHVSHAPDVSLVRPIDRNSPACLRSIRHVSDGTYVRLL